MKRLLLLGAGPTHLRVLRAFARERAACEVQWCVPHAQWFSPALLAACVAGRLPAAACRLPLAPLAQAAGVSLVEGQVERLDLAQRCVTLADGRTLAHELLSVDAADAADLERLPGAREHAWPVWPVGPFVERLEGLVAQAAERPLDVVVVGADTAAVELAFAFERRLGGNGSRVALVTGHAGPLPGAVPALTRALAARLARRRITLVRERPVRVDAQAVHVANGARLACDAAVLAEAPALPAWLRTSGLACGDDGHLRTLATGQSVSHAEVFAAGEDAMAEALGALLAQNLRRAAGGGALLAQTLKRPAWQGVSEGDRRAVAAWGPLVAEGRLAGAWLERSRRARFARQAAAG